MKFFKKIPTVGGLPKLTTKRYLPKRVKENIDIRNRLLKKYRVDFNDPEGVQKTPSGS